MITARQYYFLDEQGIAQASIRIADNPSGSNKITVFGAAKYLPYPLGEGCGQMVEHLQDRILIMPNIDNCKTFSRNRWQE